MMCAKEDESNLESSLLNGLGLFEGIGGLTIALQEFVRPVAYCESDRYCQAVLLSNQRQGKIPIAPIWDDVRTLQSDYIPHVDIIYGGFPCQDISENVSGKGLEGKRSGLFFEIMRLAEEIKPAFIFLENVRNIRAKGLGKVVSNLASLGYDCRWDILSAYTNTDFFEGERWFLLAKAISLRCEIWGIQGRNEKTASTDHRAVPGQIWNPIEDSMARTDNGLSPKTHRIRALGNAVVPHQAREAFMRLSGIDSVAESKE